MKKKFLWLLCVFMLSAPIFADMSKGEMQDMYLEYLASRNIEASVDGDGDIEFEYEVDGYGTFTFYFEIDENDQEYFRVTLLNFHTLNGDQDRAKAAVAAAYASVAANTVKVYVTSSNTIQARGEVFISSPDKFKFAYQKIMPNFAKALDEFFIRMEM